MGNIYWELKIYKIIKMWKLKISSNHKIHYQYILLIAWHIFLMLSYIWGGGGL